MMNTLGQLTTTTWSSATRARADVGGALPERPDSAPGERAAAEARQESSASLSRRPSSSPERVFRLRQQEQQDQEERFSGLDRRARSALDAYQSNGPSMTERFGVEIVSSIDLYV